MKKRPKANEIYITGIEEMGLEGRQGRGPEASVKPSLGKLWKVVAATWLAVGALYFGGEKLKDHLNTPERQRREEISDKMNSILNPSPGQVGKRYTLDNGDSVVVKDWNADNHFILNDEIDFKTMGFGSKIDSLKLFDGHQWVGYSLDGLNNLDVYQKELDNLIERTYEKRQEMLNSRGDLLEETVD